MAGSLTKTVISADAFPNSNQGVLEYRQWLNRTREDELYEIAAVQKEREKGIFQEKTTILLTDLMEDGILYWDIPEGN